MLYSGYPSAHFGWNLAGCMFESVEFFCHKRHPEMKSIFLWTSTTADSSDKKLQKTQYRLPLHKAQKGV